MFLAASRASRTIMQHQSICLCSCVTLSCSSAKPCRPWIYTKHIQIEKIDLLRDILTAQVCQRAQLNDFSAKYSNSLTGYGKSSQISTTSWLCRQIGAPNVVTSAQEHANCVNVDEEREDSSKWQSMVNDIVNALRSLS